MTAAEVTVTSRADGDVVLIVIEGEIDLSNAESVEADLSEAIPNRTMTAAVDLSNVAYIDSIGMRVLFSLVTRLETAQIGIRFIAPLGSPARRIIQISGLDAVAQVDDS